MRIIGVFLCVVMCLGLGRSLDATNQRKQQQSRKSKKKQKHPQRKEGERQSKASSASPAQASQASESEPGARPHPSTRQAGAKEPQLGVLERLRVNPPVVSPSLSVEVSDT